MRKIAEVSYTKGGSNLIWEEKINKKIKKRLKLTTMAV